MVTKPRKPQIRHTETDPPLAAAIDSKFKKKKRMVLFVHGIRDPGFWEQDLRKLFEAEGFIAKPIGYHVFDIFRFLLGFRRRAVEWVKSQIESAVHDNPDAELSTDKLVSRTGKSFLLNFVDHKSLQGIFRSETDHEVH